MADETQATAKPNLTTRVVLPFADGEYPFQLKGKEIEELQKLCGDPEHGRLGMGIGEIGARVFTGRYGVREIRETIRIGLVGGGMSPPEARRLIAFYVDGRPIAEPAGESPYDVARLILEANFFGVPEGTAPADVASTMAATREAEARAAAEAIAAAAEA